MNFEDFLNKWVYSDSWAMVNKQCTVTFNGGNCIIRTQEKDAPFVYAITAPMANDPYSGILDSGYWDDVDRLLNNHFQKERE